MAIFFRKKGTNVDADTVFENATAEMATFDLAIHTAIDLIAKTIAKCEFKTYEKNEIVKKDNYYLFNFAPNKNQNSVQFWYRVIEKLIFDGECLVVMKDNKLYIADDFEVRKYVLFDWVFDDVVVDQVPIGTKIPMSEVFYFNYSDKSTKDLIDKYYQSFGKLLAASIGYYKRSKASRWIFEYGTVINGREELEEKIRNSVKPFIDADGSTVYPMGQGTSLKNVSDNQSGRVESDSSDIRNLVNYIFDIVAVALHIPKSLLIGDKLETSDNLDNMITFAIEPFTELFQREINKKYYSKDDVLSGTFAKVDTTKIKHVETIESAKNLESLFRIGFSFNDLLILLGQEPISEEWASVRHITKNYMTTTESLKGGE